MQSGLNLLDFLPGFVLRALCRAGKARRRASSSATGPRSNASAAPETQDVK